MANPLLDPAHYHGPAPYGVSATNADVSDEGDASGLALDDLVAYKTSPGWYRIDGVKVQGKAAASEALDAYLGRSGSGEGE